MTRTALAVVALALAAAPAAADSWSDAKPEYRAQACANEYEHMAKEKDRLLAEAETIKAEIQQYGLTPARQARAHDIVQDQDSLTMMIKGFPKRCPPGTWKQNDERWHP